MDLKQALQQFDRKLIEIQTKLPGQTDACYFRPQTLAQSDRVAAMIEADASTGDGAKLALTIIESVLDKEGDKVFSLGDKSFLMNECPQQPLIDIINEMAATPTIEDAEGN